MVKVDRREAVSMCRKTGSILIAILIASVLSVKADTIEFIATLRGQIQAVGAKKATSVTETNFVAPGDLLLVQVDLSHGTMTFLEAMPPTNNPSPFKGLLQTNHSVVMTNKDSITVTLLPIGSGSTLALPGGLVFGGEISGAGTVSFSKGEPKGFKAALTGIWNDPLLGDTNSPGALFKASVVGKIPGAK
jgi:hydrogenase maturation factor HypE